MEIVKGTGYSSNDALVLVAAKDADLPTGLFNQQELAYISQSKANEADSVVLNQYTRFAFVLFAPSGDDTATDLEKLRKAGAKLLAKINKEKISTISVDACGVSANAVLAATEGIALGSYQFLKYFSDADKKAHSLTQISIIASDVQPGQIAELNAVCKSVYQARDFVNEPLQHLTAKQWAIEVQELGKSCGFSVDVFDKKKIESLKMGGLLAVNRGSIDPPAFMVLEWKPENAVNQRPVVLVGKGIVYDTGGYSLKPTPKSMDYMKCDMAGGAAVIGAVQAVSLNKLPLHLIALVPATDNRIDGNAYVPGDVITMHDGTTVEVLNTDAEGRLALADALSYAKKYDPELVLDLATLTGAAVRAVGESASAVMGTAPHKTFEALEQAAFGTYERIIQFPLWDEFGEEIKSSIADLKNIGGGNAGHITAGKFLQHFVTYPWIHIDIAGPSFNHQKDSYRGQNGTGTGVRLLYHFLKNLNA